MHTLPHRVLGNQDHARALSVSAIGLGCMGMSGVYGASDEDEAVRTIHAAMDEGVDLLDTSDMYGAGHNETLVGRAIKGRRDEVLVSTKFGQVVGADGRPAGIDGRPEYVHQAFEASARRLGVDYIDLYYQHRVDANTPIEDTVGAMAELVAAGKVGHLGLCEASVATLRRAHGVHPIAALQSEYSLWWRGPEAEILPACAELGIGYVAYSPLGRGLFSGTVRTVEDLAPDDRRRDHPRFAGENLDRNLALVDGVAEVAHELGCTLPQLAVAWVLARSEHIVAIPGAKRVQHLQDNLGALRVELDAAIVQRLDSLAPEGAGAGLRYPQGAMAALER